MWLTENLNSYMRLARYFYWAVFPQIRVQTWTTPAGRPDRCSRHHQGEPQGALRTQDQSGASHSALKDLSLFSLPLHKYNLIQLQEARTQICASSITRSHVICTLEASHIPTGPTGSPDVMLTSTPWRMTADGLDALGNQGPWVIPTQPNGNYQECQS